MKTGDMENQLDPELEKLIKEVKLREPSQEKMADYLARVHAKIDRGPVSSGFGFPQIGLVLAAGIALAGLVYLVAVTRTQGQLTPPVAEVSERAESLIPTVSQAPTVEPISTPEALSIEEEMAILEGLGEEFTEEAVDLFEDEDLLEELALVDELEFSLVPETQPSVG